MGLLSGGNKNSTTQNFQETTTDSFNETTTVSHSTSTMGDIGLTGQQGVELAAVAAGAGSQISMAGFEAVQTVSNDASENYQLLVNGAAGMFNAQNQLSYDAFSEVVGAAENNADAVFSGFSSLAESNNTTVASLVNASSALAENAASVAGSSIDTAADVASAAQAGPIAQLVKQGPVLLLGLGTLFIVFKMVKK